MKFTCTEEAIEYGRKATRREIEELKERRYAALQLAVRMKNKGDFDRALQHTFAAQFYREAIEEADFDE